MGDSRNDHGTDKRTGRPTNSVLYIWGTLADTTWRLFVPTVGATLLGLWLDNLLETKPWLMIVGVVLGSVAAALLVRTQLRNTR